VNLELRNIVYDALIKSIPRYRYLYLMRSRLGQAQPGIFDALALAQCCRQVRHEFLKLLLNHVHVVQIDQVHDAEAYLTQLLSPFRRSIFIPPRKTSMIKISLRGLRPIPAVQHGTTFDLIPLMEVLPRIHAPKRQKIAFHRSLYDMFSDRHHVLPLVTERILRYPNSAIKRSRWRKMLLDLQSVDLWYSDGRYHLVFRLKRGVTPPEKTMGTERRIEDEKRFRQSWGVGWRTEQYVIIVEHEEEEVAWHRAAVSEILQQSYTLQFYDTGRGRGVDLHWVGVGLGLGWSRFG
jgi:hypothetical protein